MRAIPREPHSPSPSVSSKSCRKAGIYYSHYECYGHTAIVMAIGEVFKKRFPGGDLFFIQAGLDQPKAKLGQLGKVYSLPGAFVSRRNFREPVNGVGADAMQRGKVCSDIISREKPDLFITEFFPFGWEECRHEMIAPLAKAHSQKTAIWAVMGHPLITGTNYEWREKLIKIYQRIIILSPVLEKEYMADSYARKADRQRYLDFFERNRRKIHFAGYLLPKEYVVYDDADKNISNPAVPKGACRVTVVRGGGAYYPKIIADAILASELLGPEYYLTVVAGPATTSKEWYFFSTLVGRKKIKNVVLLKSAGNYEELIAQSDVCVAVASYNTAVMILKHLKKAIFIPFEGYGATCFSEQRARAAMFKDKIGSQLLHISAMTASSLAEKVRKTVSTSRMRSNFVREWFTGENYLVSSLESYRSPK